jgi:predicted  nucleic acid-binding Zn-ribbon protein
MFDTLEGQTTGIPEENPEKIPNENKKRGRKAKSVDIQEKQKRKRTPKTDSSKVAQMKRYEECRKKLTDLHEQKQKIEESIQELTKEMETLKEDLINYLAP